MTLATPVVNLFRNPWRSFLDDSVVAELLMVAAVEAGEQLHILRQSGQAKPHHDSFGAVILDPTRPRGAVGLAHRILATIELGPDGRGLLPNAAAKADAHDRHGCPNGELVAEASHCLGDGDFAWGNSAEYRRAIGGGSGLSVEQDRDLVYLMLERFIDPVRRLRDDHIAERRRHGKQGWYNTGNNPGAEYAAVLGLVPLATPVPQVT